jgi:hypothetical protein
MVTLTIDTDRQRQGHLRIPVPGLTKSIQWDGEQTWGDIRKRADGQWELVCLDRLFTKAVLNVELE